MSAKKKSRTNPNRIPIPQDSFDMQQLLDEATHYNVYRAWLLVLGALADYYDTTSEQLLHLWRVVSEYSDTVQTYADISEDLKIVDQVLGRTLPHHNLSIEGIKTQGDLNKLKRKLHRNAMYAGFSIIAYPIIHNKLLAEDRIKAVFDRAYDHDDAVCERRISLEDIEGVLADEYGLLLTYENKKVYLQKF